MSKRKRGNQPLTSSSQSSSPSTGNATSPPLIDTNESMTTKDTSTTTKMNVNNNNSNKNNDNISNSSSENNNVVEFIETTMNNRDATEMFTFSNELAVALLRHFNNPLRRPKVPSDGTSNSTAQPTVPIDEI
jgi:hypothetical protein